MLHCRFCGGWVFPACYSSRVPVWIPTPSRWTTSSRTSARPSASAGWGAHSTPPQADPPRSCNSSTWSPAMPYDRRLTVGDELAERFEVDQARLRAEGRIFLDPEDLDGLAADGCEVANHTRSHLFCRSIGRRGIRALSARRPCSTARVVDRPPGSGVQLPVRSPRGRDTDGRAGAARFRARGPVPGGVTTRSDRGASAGSGTGSRLDGCPSWRVGPELELMPRLNLARHQLRVAASLI